MELSKTISLRENQFSSLHMLLFSAYSELQVQYDQQKLDLVEYKRKANYWEAQFKHIKSTESELISQIESLKAALRKREQQLFGKSSERGTTQTEIQNPSQKSNLKRGQQPGEKGHGKKIHTHLPSVEEIISLPQQNAVCKCCGLPFKELSMTEDSEVIEVINVKAYRRNIRRKMYKRSCHCPVSEAGSRLVAAPVVLRLIPKSKFGISVWALLLIKKYLYQQPLNRALSELSGNGLSLSTGSIVDGFKVLSPLLVPIYDLIVKRNLEADHWHADETGWRVFECTEAKQNHRWYLWIFKSKDTVVYKLDPSRSSRVPMEHFGTETEGILSVDRYVAYKTIAKAGLFILAFCWAHVRRDFLSHAKGYPKEESWALAWVDRIGKLYHLNHERLSLSSESAQFKTSHEALNNEIVLFKNCLDGQLKEVGRSKKSHALLASLNRHWEGLTVFLENPHIPMDNNSAERGLRPPVVGRKNYYGSGSIWSGELAVIMFTIFSTLKLWGINPHTWLLAYFQEATLSPNRLPTTPEKFLPWNMNDQQKILFSEPPIGEDSG